MRLLAALKITLGMLMHIAVVSYLLMLICPHLMKAEILSAT